MPDRYQSHRRLAWRIAGDGTDRITKHPYLRDVHSGAGNCWCGRHEESSLHANVAASVVAAYADLADSETPSSGE